MRVRNVLLSIIALAAVGGHVAAIDRGAFVVDGDWKDWGSLGDLDRSWDVIPDTNSAVDIGNYGFGTAEFPKHGGELTVFILRFWAPPFQGPEETRVEWFFDTLSDTSHGEIKAPWKMFRPDYRVAIVGKNGAITKEVYGRYVDGRWVFKEGADIAELESAVSGQYVEGAIPVDAVYPPLPELPAMVNFKVALEVSKGQFWEYVPDDAWYNPWHPFGGYGWATVIEPESWGRLKER